MKKPKHMMGKSTGYSDLGDGAIGPAPLHCDAIEKVIVEEAAAQALLASVTRELQVIMIAIQERKVRFWRSVQEDYSLDFDRYEWSYDRSARALRRIAKEKLERKG